MSMNVTYCKPILNITYNFKHLYKSQLIQHLRINIKTGFIKITPKASVF